MILAIRSLSYDKSKETALRGHAFGLEMKTLNIVLSLTTKTNDFQVELGVAAQAAAERLGINLEVLFADDDAILQSQQLLRVVQLPRSSRPDAIFFHPAGSTALAQVARAAAAAGIAVGVLNWRADYIQELRQKYGVLAFIYSSDHAQIGRIQAQQMGALLPEGGLALYIQGPSSSMGAQNRLAGMLEKKPVNVQAKVIKTSSWTEDAGYRAVASWLRLSTAHSDPVDLVVAQNDLIAMGARKAFGEINNEADRERWLNLPFTGIDGLPKTGQVWVQKGLLAATVAVPPNAGLAIEAMAKAIHTHTPLPECILTEPKSYPAIEDLRRRKRGR